MSRLDPVAARRVLARSRPTLRQRLHIRRYPVWSAKAVALLALLDLGLSAAILYGLGDKSLFLETELTLAVIAGSLFLFLTVGLFRGVRIRREQLTTGGKGWSLDGDFVDLSGLDLPDIGLDLDFDEGILGVIVAMLVSIVAVIFLAGLAWVLINVVWGLAIVLAVAVFWVFNRALRQVFAHSRRCRGNLAASLTFAALYTTLYTGWLFVLVWAIHHFVGVSKA
jgi:hypothetical protein